MVDEHILIIGQGSIGHNVTNQLVKHGKMVTGLARGQRQEYNLDADAGFIQADILSLSAEHLLKFTHIAIIVSPDEYNGEAYRRTYFGIAQHIASLQKLMPNATRIVFISSTGVYGQDNGEWIDETVHPKSPAREASKYILQAEQVLQQAYLEKTIVIRPSGIYGNNRLMRVRNAQDNNKSPMPQYAWTNRIMDSDLVTIIVNVLIEKDSNKVKPMYLATDYSPVTSYELTCWLSDKLGSTQPKILTAEKAENVSGKRLLSNIPRNWLEYPDWKIGYTAVLKSLKKL